MENDTGNSEYITAVVELSGRYEDIANILGGDADRYPELSSIYEDIGEVVDIVVRTGGATKSRIAAELPPGMARELDAEDVIHVLRVLELYGIVELDGNTWRPGPALSAGTAG